MWGRGMSYLVLSPACRGVSGKYDNARQEKIRPFTIGEERMLSQVVRVLSLEHLLGVDLDLQVRYCYLASSTINIISSSVPPNIHLIVEAYGSSESKRHSLTFCDRPEGSVFEAGDSKANYLSCVRMAGSLYSLTRRD